MRVAVVFIPGESAVTVHTYNTQERPRAFVLGRGPELGVLTGLFLTTFALIVWSFSTGLRCEPAAALDPYVCAVPARLLAHRMEDTNSVKTGDFVIVAARDAVPVLRKVAATPNELWNGQPLKNFYAEGEDGFLVVSGDRYSEQYSVVHTDEIRASFRNGCIPNG